MPTDTCALGEGAGCIAGPSGTPAPRDPACPWGRCAKHCKNLGHGDHSGPDPRAVETPAILGAFFGAMQEPSHGG